MEYQEVKDVVDRFFEDTSRTAEETAVMLEDLRDHIDMLVESSEA